MEFKEIKLDPNGPIPEVDVFFGQAQFAKYIVELLDSDGKNPQVIMQGNNIDNLPDHFSIGVSPQDLVGNHLSWSFTIAAPASGEGQLYFARITITQGGKNLKDGPFEYSGPLDGVKMKIDLAEFVV